MKYPGSLHNHSDWSNLKLRDSINRVDDLIKLAIELGHNCIAFTEHEILSGSIAIEKSYDKIKKDYPEFKVIRGNEIYLVRNGLNAENYNKEYDSYTHFVLLAKDAIGHQQIRELSTRAWMRSYEQHRQIRVPTYYNDIIEIIGKNPGHVIGSTACIGGALGKQLLRYRLLKDENHYQSILDWCKNIQEIFGEDNFYLELQPSADPEQIFVNKEIIKISKMLNIPFIITNDAHYARPEDASIHEAFLNSQDGDREVAKFYATTYLMNDDEVRSFMKDILTEEELEQAYRNILNISFSCEDYSLRKKLHIPRLLWKKDKPILTQDYWTRNIPMLNQFLESEYEEDNLLAKLIMNVIEEDEQYQTFETYTEINACLNDTWISSEVNNARWSAYFLNLQTIVDTCWEAGSLVGCGRGSGVGFILLNMLGITQINPLREKTATFRWRFLNPERASVLDVDIDIESNKRSTVLNKFREIYGEYKVANVLAIGTEKSKSAIITAARGLGIDVDEARYLSSLIVADRGQIRTLKQTYYGDIEQGFAPNATFKKEMDVNYPELWQVAQKIEGLISRVGVHAGGVIFTDEDFTDSVSLMKAPSGETITAFDLHDAESASLIKYDILSIEALDRIHVCLDLLEEYEYIPQNTLKEKYQQTVGIYNIERENPTMWKMCWEHKIIDLFQMEKQSGIKGIALLKPTSVDDLAILNSAIRLMASEKGAEVPVEKLARFKRDLSAWDEELRIWGLGEEDKKILEPIVGISYGLCIAQEQFMELVQLPALGGFDLNWADRLRKSIAKKNPAEYEQLTKEYYEITAEKNCKANLCKYVWEVLIAMSRGYGFNQSHTLAYSLVGLQEMNLAYRFPTIIWDTACIINSSGSVDSENGASTDYAKLAQAIGAVRDEDIQVSLANVNKSQFGFIPDVENNQILFGLKGIQGIGDEIVTKIIENRPYASPLDFINKVNPTKSVMIALIKAGAFDEMEDRKFLMAWYLWRVCDKKEKLNLQNMASLTKYDLLPSETEEQRTAFSIYEFNRYLKAKCKFNSTDYLVDERAINFLTSMGYDGLIIQKETFFFLGVKAWDKVYQKWMDVFRAWLKENHDEVLNKLNTIIFLESWNKYAKGTLSSWEMESLCFYYHEHELINVDKARYGIKEFAELPAEPIVERSFTKGGKTINLYKLDRICGTCLATNKDKATVTLLTTSGVVTVKFRKDYYSLFSKQISEKQADGKKKIKERSWFKRGSMIVVTGMRQEEEFIAKKYSSTPGHTLYKIDEIRENGELVLRNERYKGAEEEDEEI